MMKKDIAALRRWRFVVVVASVLLTTSGLERISFSNIGQDATAQKATKPSAPSAPDERQSAKSGSTGKKAQAEKSSSESRSLKKPGEETSPSPQQKKATAILLVDGVLANAHKISPVEYGILAQVEAATLLWNLDKEQSLSILKNAVEAMQKLFEEQNEGKTSSRLSDKQVMLRASVLRKIARLSPDLLKKLLAKDSADDKQVDTLSKGPTVEAGAILQAAEQMIAENPDLAVRMAEQSFPFGLGNWPGFLVMLNNRDSQRAEQLAMSLINRLRDSSISPLNFQEVNVIVFGRNGSTQLREHYFRSLAIRLRRDIRPDLPPRELETSLGVARNARRMTAGSFPRFKMEFEEIAAALDTLYLEHNKSPYTSPPPIKIDTSMMEGAKSGDTREIEDAASRTDKVISSRSRDKEYQKLATGAALRADQRLAEDMLSKIENEDMRQETSVMVYAPLAQKAASESDWSQAQILALKIIEPLGRTIVLDGIARRMPQSEEGKQKAKEIYDAADAQLRRDIPEENVAKAYLILARSLLSADPEAGIEAMRSAVYALNKSTLSDDLIEDSAAIGAIAPWITLPGPSFSHSEALEITELIGPLFKETAKRNADEAQAIAYGLKHQGLYSLAQLGIARELLEEAMTSRKPLQNQKSK